MLTRNHQPKKRPLPAAWRLQDAKARFSEVVRRARSEGPQHVTVHGKEAVVVVSANDFKKAQLLANEKTGAAFVEAMQQARKLGLRLKPFRYYPVYRAPVVFEDGEK